MTPHDLATKADLSALETRLAELIRQQVQGPGLTDYDWAPVAEHAARKGVGACTVNRWVREGLWQARGAGKQREVRRAAPERRGRA